ncbi:bromodomain-containing protein [Xylaria bambusicola]|uniref:bromodomain-containing protein n=1 Tax=Xylaria bambusicola TaxID=326684 RepID=UPI002008974D|nr:bromodomain-containing protein [Xylaria bambusicola]KAI0517780.1 bromodomain-containing protein [Xylaria bambusicola]
MSITNGQPAWPPPAHPHHAGVNGIRGSDDAPARSLDSADNSATLMPEASDIEEERHRAHFAELYRRTESRISLLFGDDGSCKKGAIDSIRRPLNLPVSLPPATDHTPLEERPAKRVKRVINEDDYGDDDDDDDDESTEDTSRPGPISVSPLKSKSTSASKGLLSPSKSGSSPVPSITSPGKLKEENSQVSQIQASNIEDARKQLEEARKDTEEAAKRSFHTIIYTLETDHTAMREQQQLEESEKALQAEMDKNNHSHTSGNAPGENHGSLSSANLGASSLTLKHLIARIDMKRDMVAASDAELRSLMNEVRKNRSKWASEENVNQEELYEALEKVLTELKAHTEYSTPFLQRVNKRDAPDYYNFIKQPMDLGSMTKKLKSLNYKSKTDFVTDLNLIWDNCLRYNQDMNHPLRRMANGMRREAEKLIPLIPDLVIRPRAEVEAEERRKQNGGDDDGGDDSDDEPIMSSRGRVAGGAKGTKSRKAPNDQKEGTPNNDQKPVLQLNGLLAKANREGSELDGSNGFGTPPVGGSMTPSGLNGHSGMGSNVDAMDLDVPSINGMALGQALSDAAQQVYEDEEYKIWKQVTKKDRALITKQRFELFDGKKLNIEEPALLRTKAGMRRYLRSLQQADASGVIGHAQGDVSTEAGNEATKAPETLAEGMEEDEEKVIPDYYEPQTFVPDIPAKLQWIEDNEGQVINQHEEFLRTLPPGYFTAPKGLLAQKIDANLRQMQETRKVCSKIGVIKQMQLQTQVYANQFPKYNPDPFCEADIEPHVTCGDDLVMAPEVCRAALQRSVAKLFYHAGFEEYQPSALDTITDIAADYFGKVVQTFKTYTECEKTDSMSTNENTISVLQPRYSNEQAILHTLAENGYSIEALESYAKDEVDRLGNKLSGIHERMKTHLSDLLRPAVTEGSSSDGAAAFNDGSEQFVGGDFAEELGEDFFGFKELGLAGELGGVLSVPLHLLQSRVRNQYQAQSQAQGPTDAVLFEELPPPEPVTKENIQEQIGLVKNFFLAKLHANGDLPLVEDKDLPVKQRRPQPRLGATGKIVSPQKRPPKEQNAINKKKKKLEQQAAEAKKVKLEAEKAATLKKTILPPNGSTSRAISVAVPPPMERMESTQSQGNNSPTDKDDTGIPMSPESIER